MKQTVNKLTPKAVNKTYSKVFTQEQITVTAIDGTNYTINIDTKFKTTKMQSLIIELSELIKNLSNYDEFLEVHKIYQLLVIKYFTDISVETNTFAEQVAFFNALLDIEVADKIIEAFDPVELEKVNEFMAKASKNIQAFKKNPKAVEAMGDLMKDIEEKFGDSEVDEVEDDTEDADVEDTEQVNGLEIE